MRGLTTLTERGRTERGTSKNYLMQWLPYGVDRDLAGAWQLQLLVSALVSLAELIVSETLEPALDPRQTRRQGTPLIPNRA